jgi:hypothetical protein
MNPRAPSPSSRPARRLDADEAQTLHDRTRDPGGLRHRARRSLGRCPKDPSSEGELESANPVSFLEISPFTALSNASVTEAVFLEQSDHIQVIRSIDDR